MKKAFVCAAFLVSAMFAQSQRRHALLIGIGDYNTPVTNWSKLNSLRDVELVKSALERKGFNPADIKTVVNAQATREGIVAAMKQLIESVKPKSKDVVYVHISSHGAQIEDNNKDETDGLDEAIVTINARWTEDPAEFKKVAGDYLRDDDFGDLIEQLRDRLGEEGDVAVFMDLCHSGTATRGELVARGNKAPIVSSAFKAKKGGNENLKEFRENTTAARGDSKRLATYVVFSAARAEEAAYETKNDEDQKMGALTYAVCKSLENIKDSSTSYRALFASIEAIMDIKSNIQHPVLEGSGVDRGFLGGRMIYQKPYVEIESIDAVSKTIRIKAGSFSGVDEGSVISFYPSGTTDPEKATAVAKGKVSKAAQFTADVTVERDPGRQPKDLWAFVTEPVFKLKPIIVRINDVAKKGAAARPLFTEQETVRLKEKLKPLKLISYGTDNADLLLVKGAGHDSLLLANNGYLFATTEQKPLEEQLKLFAKYKYLKELEVKDPGIKVEVKLGKWKDNKNEFLKPSKTIAGYEYKVGETMIVAFKNNGDEPVYINILDFQPDGIVNPIFPNKSPRKGAPIQPTELRIEAKEEKVFSAYRILIGPPLGSEVLKIFVSDQVIDMEDIARGLRSRSLMKAMEKVVDDAPEIATRGAEPINLKEAKGAVFNIPFRIVAAQ